MGCYLVVLEALDEHYHQHGKRHMTVPASLGTLGFYSSSAIFVFLS